MTKQFDNILDFERALEQSTPTLWENMGVTQEEFDEYRQALLWSPGLNQESATRGQPVIARASVRRREWHFLFYISTLQLHYIFVTVGEIWQKTL